jgi:glutamate racemase
MAGWGNIKVVPLGVIINPSMSPHLHKPDARGPIGIFDSGIGGYSVLREIRALLPREDLIYVADTGHIPYGDKNEDFIRARCFTIADFLLGRNAKALVIACNTATAAAADSLRARYPRLPVIAMEPGIKPAVAASRKRIIGVLATAGTLAGQRFARLLAIHAADARVICQPCPQLVEVIEQGDLEAPALHELLELYTRPLLQQGVDTIILGCTHYVLVRNQLQQLCPEVELIDTGGAVARHLASRLQDLQLLSAAGGQTLFYTSGDLKQLQTLLQKLGEKSAKVEAMAETEKQSA